ncbi:MAG: Ig-like domain-containing protein [Firmicutes bacterium]|nr:Ig-like domain-containing protein [Bacillota bacterium]
MTSIEVTTQPKTGYTEGEKLDLTGLVAILTDKNGNKQEVTFEDLGDYEITANPTNGTELTVADHDNKPITLTKGDLTAYTDKLTISERASSSAPEVIQPIEGDKAINGTGETGATIVVTNKDGEELGTATVGEDGTWSVNIPADKELTAGDTISITQMESGKKPTTIKESVAERASSSAPEVIQPIEGNKAINGTGETGATIVVTNKDGEELGTATVGEDGKWTVNVPADKELTAGDTISITQTESGKKPTTITETIEERASSSVPEVTQPIEGDKVIKGNGVSDATIQVTLPGMDDPIETTVGEDGKWTVNVPADKELTAGDTISVTQTETGKKPITTEVTVETKPHVQKPSSPAVDPVTEGDSVIRVTPPSDGDRIAVTLPDGSTVVVNKDDDGNWKTEGGTAVPTEDGKLQIPVDGDKVVPGGKGVDVTVTDTTTNETSDPTHRDVEAKPEDKTSVNYPNTDIGRGETKVINPTITDKNGDPVKPDAAPTITDAPGHGIVVTPNSDGSLTVQVPEGYKGPSRVTIGVEVTVGGKTLQTEVVVTIEDEDKPIAPPVDHGGNWITLTPIDKDDQSKLEKGEHIAYIYGYPDKTVKPEGMITRAEAAAMISRLADLDRSDTSKPMYVDTPSGWYNRDINAMVKKNLMFGEDGKFRPNEPITRGEFARALYYIDHKSDEVAPFGDVKGHRYEEAINQAYGNGRISGYPDGTFRPDAPIQRAEAARLLNRFAGRSVSERGLIDVRGDVACFDDLSKGHWAYYEIVEASNSHRYVRMNKDNIEEMWTAIMNLVQH